MTTTSPSESSQDVAAETVDVLIVGAGLSGIGAAHHLQSKVPGKTYTILESRGAIGGTWDLFRYPGIRSDSDMYTLGYNFRPWTGDKSIADGKDIREYIENTARDGGIDENIRFHHRVVKASWSTKDSRWTIVALRSDTGETVTFHASFLMCCSGYYDYTKGFTPEFDGIDDFGGTVVHPQLWPEDLDYAGKKVVVIGSGATAITLAPNLAREADHVTLLQRSPSYIMSLPSKDPIALALRKYLPAKAAYGVTRLKNAVTAIGLYVLCQRYPKFMKKQIRKLQEKWLPEGYDLDTHFTPKYNPWDQRLCLVPDNDLFRCIRKGEVELVTDHIDRFDADGIRLQSGGHLDADIVITATGLNLVAFGHVDLEVDGRTVDLTETMAYKGMMLTDVPNFAFVVGYTNASWTLKADLVCDYVCRLLQHMDAGGHREVRLTRDPSIGEEPFLDFAAGYVLRSVDSFPKQGSKAPWRLRMNYFRDLPVLRYGSVVDDNMSFR
ncbi:flavin-containing monooxygenase [Rhodococcoides kyotonense]|uniref:Predicted flavoprotein CzcO associated with the cation diffusion facilitator CzcD n=1 Tax=Rhodococcoides kyotonense TaxID=398843 RepID=A0A239HEH3_9NOCA|nr:NAD(P)/FAD-dependent oxidoreductase [Rhodococcus kyotonensis]SNS78664.1 Predicted flavoprotein CzcO associated with the cation diffusion facilitator CzcD [Rhodococcus kyotonensis]